jgi:hypothetical protein
MIFFGQRDLRWSFVKLGKTNRTIGQVGCTTCTLSDASSYFGIEKRPDTLAHTLDYTPDALIIWGSLPKVGLKLVKRFYASEPLSTVLGALKDNKTTVSLNVDNGSHWVFALRYLGFGKYWVSDPWTNSKKIYGGVVGGAIITKA